MISRLAYRLRQFWNALQSHRRPISSDRLQPYLTPTELVLFQRMQPSEQFHAYQTLTLLQASGQTDPDLLTAALLHDVGKILYPLSIFDRVIIVLGKTLFPGAAQRWAQGAPRGLQRPFVVAARHAGWGADLVYRAGTTARAAEFIRHHQDATLPEMDPHSQSMLAALQAADDKN